MDRLKNKVALITGGTKGIGETAARLFAEEGAKVIICGRSREDGERVAREINEAAAAANTAGPAAAENEAAAADGSVSAVPAAEAATVACYCPLDVADYASWEQAIAFAEREFGKLNILINNAGISFAETVETTTPESWKQVIDVNQTGVFYGMQLAIQALSRAGEPGAIVSTASVDGHVGDELYFAYCASKAAVEAMTRCAAIYCGKHGLDIRVNAVAPGYILTPMAEEDAAQQGMTIQEYCADSARLHPLGRLGTPMEVAQAYLYLASEESSFVTGTTLMVDGGYTAW